ncbi:methyltransferase [Actinophytocola sp.]|uniref:methyltransferase n=1 Tax=Actinophytocola sp. TaxID=1872138 RepID=UPI003D6B81A1
MADRLGILSTLRGTGFAAAQIAAVAGIPERSAADFLAAASAAGIIVENPQPGTFRAADDLDEWIYESGYLSWALNANRPFIEHVTEFLRRPEQAGTEYRRDGRQVAVSSQWMGSRAFYPLALSTIVEAKPRRAVDLGAGTARLLIEVLQQVPGSTAVALDIDAGACREADAAARAAGLDDRLTVVERSIQSVADDPEPLRDADIIHAGFVFHDLMPDEEDVADAVLANCRRALRPGGILAITEAVPYVPDERERRFSTIVTYFHQQFMLRRLLTEQEWIDKLSAAGFSTVTAARHRFPTGRLFVATNGSAE